MDKQKQIEEMYDDISERLIGVLGCEKMSLAIYQHNAGYRKIPENAVVLTREELEERDCKNHHEGHKTGVAGMQEQVEALKNKLQNPEKTDNA